MKTRLIANNLTHLFTYIAAKSRYSVNFVETTSATPDINKHFKQPFLHIHVYTSFIFRKRKGLVCSGYLKCFVHVNTCIDLPFMFLVDFF